MSESWEIYPCSMGERIAFISFDYGIHEQLKTLNLANAAGFRVALQQQDDRGMPIDAEFARLDAIEDALVAAMPGAVAVQVGRVTTDGFRYFHFYTSLDEAAVELINAQLSRQFSVEICLLHEHDPEHKVYWEELYPTTDDWRVIEDRRVQDALKKAGDDLQQPRPVQHWAYFKSAQQRDRFIAELGTPFERVKPYTADNGEFAVTLFHHGLPDFYSMNPHTLHLDRLARQLDGSYDGWETQVCRAKG